MTSRERVLSSLKHRQPDRVPVDLSGYRSSGIAAIAYPKLRAVLDLEPRPIDVYDPVQQLAIVHPDVLDCLGIDTLELGRGFVAAIVEDHGRADALAAVTIDGGHVGAANAVMREVFVERLHPHSPHALGDQVADRVIHHRRRDAGLQAKAVREVGRHVKLAAADVDLALGCLAEGDDARIETMHDGAER